MASPHPTPVRRLSVKIAAVLIPVTLYGFARLPVVGSDERKVLASQFRFETQPLSALPGSDRNVRAVNPSVERISSWISSVGASVALGDVDGDGFSNDYCLVDPRTDRVSVESVPVAGAQRLQPFTLTTPDVAANPTIAPMGCRLGDFNEDGLTDVLVYYWGRTPLVFLRRASATGGAPAADQFRAVDIVRGGSIWNTNAVTAADVDGDGHLDLIVGNYFPDGAAMLDPHSPTPVSMQNSMARAFNGGANRILRWIGATAGTEPTVEFTDVPDVFPPDVAHGWTLAAGAADLDGDLLPEIYFANDFGPDRLLHNRSRPGEIHLVPVEGRKRFTDPNSKVLGRDSFKGMGVDFGDLNGDGRLDIYVTNITNAVFDQGNMLWKNLGGLRFANVAREMNVRDGGWGWGAKFADLDNDGDLDLYSANGFVSDGPEDLFRLPSDLYKGDVSDLRAWPDMRGFSLSGHERKLLFRNDGNGFLEMAADAGLDAESDARGVILADIDGDGDVDLLVTNVAAAPMLYRNELGQRKAWLEAELIGTTSNRDAIGARLSLTTGKRRQIREVDGGNGYCGQSSRVVHFGIDAAERADELEVRWPSGRRERHRDLPARTKYVFTEEGVSR